MSNSLRDQLVKAGLASSAQAKKADKQQRAEELNSRRSTKQTKQQKNKHSATESTSKPSAVARARNHALKKSQQDKQNARQQNDKYAQRALRAEIRDLLKQHDKRTKVSDTDAVAYNFVHGKKIKRIYVSTQERELLSSGQLMIVNNDGIYHFVLPQVANKIAERDAKRIIVAHKPDDTAKKNSADDDFYAQFEVPDDLDW